MTEDEHLRFLAIDGMLVTCPLAVVGNGTVLTGLKIKEWEQPYYKENLP